MSTAIDNPYVGPRTFTRAEADRFFGREREARRLLSRVISERLVLFYAESGAGKSSLINTRLIPQLQEAQFSVLPVGRVSGKLPHGVSEVDNIFAFNLILSLDQSEDNPNRFTRMSLSHFLARLTANADETFWYYDEAADFNAADEVYVETPHVLIIDQFEEIITTHLENWEHRVGFFGQLDQAMVDDPLLWVVLTLREDYVASLEPYAYLLADKFRARFYMQKMNYRAALDAVKKPAGLNERPFVPGVAETLVDNLRQIRVYGQPEPQLGQVVEPVQLQVVCYQLWEDLKGRTVDQITEQDLQETGNVDTALAKFYEQAVAKALSLKIPKKMKVSETGLRNWFSHQVITEAGTRGNVYRGDELTGGLPTAVADFLVDQHLLRIETRAGGQWFELIHDRFIEPILKSNQEWDLYNVSQISVRSQILLALVLSLALPGLIFIFNVIADTIVLSAVVGMYIISFLVSLFLVRLGLSIRTFIIFTKRALQEEYKLRVFIKNWLAREKGFLVPLFVVIIIFLCCLCSVLYFRQF